MSQLVSFLLLLSLTLHQLMTLSLLTVFFAFNSHFILSLGDDRDFFKHSYYLSPLTKQLFFYTLCLSCQLFHESYAHSLSLSLSLSLSVFSTPHTWSFFKLLPILFGLEGFQSKPNYSPHSQTHSLILSHTNACTQQNENPLAYSYWILRPKLYSVSSAV